MFRTPGGEVVVTDYGVGRISSAGVNTAEYKRKGDAVGSIPYWAPELFGESNANTFASDVCVTS